MIQDFNHRIARVVSFVFFNLVFLLFTRPHIEGRENIPHRGPLVVVSNHLSYADQYLLTIAVNREMIFLAKEELFRNSFKRFLIETFGAIPVRRGAVNRGALKQVHRVLDSGQAVFMFPEGSRSKNAELKPAYSGSVLIAVHNNAPVLPIGITGMEVAEKGFRWVMLHRPRVTVRIGKPFHIAVPNGKLDKKNLRALADEIMVHIAELLPHEYRGYYANGDKNDFDAKGDQD
mgnify:CR=1 FL=1